MVHTEPIQWREHLPHLADISVAAFCDSGYNRFVRPKSIEYPDGAFHKTLHNTRMAAVSPDHVVRVAVADDADPWVDVGLKGLAAERSKWIRGELAGGKWRSAELVNGELQSKVSEGRVLGHAIWKRVWPEDAADAKLVKERCGSGTVWPVDSVWNKTERAMFSLASSYFGRINPDPAESPENAALVESEGVPQLVAFTKLANERSKHVGHIGINSIAVDPTFHRKGIGALLMRWGLERAEIERCPIIIVASSQGCRLYEKLGFETLGVLTIGDFTGDKVMVYWPQSFEAPSGA